MAPSPESAYGKGIRGRRQRKPRRLATILAITSLWAGGAGLVADLLGIFVVLRAAVNRESTGEGEALLTLLFVYAVLIVAIVTSAIGLSTGIAAVAMRSERERTARWGLATSTLAVALVALLALVSIPSS